MEVLKVAGRFILKNPMGATKDGQVYLGLDTVTMQHARVCVNGSQDSHVSEKWKHETEMLQKVGPHPGFTNLVYSSFQDHSAVFVTSFPGDTLAQICLQHENGLSMKTLYTIADQMLERFDFLHEIGLVYGNVNPATISIEKFEGTEILRLIDFSSARCYPDNKKADGAKLRFSGCLRYASIRTHQGQELSWKDDLESMAYMLVYLAKGRLPWMDAPGNTPKEKSNSVLQMKLGTEESEICRDLPPVFAEFMSKVRNLQVGEKPNYLEYRQMFADAAKSQQIVIDGGFNLSSKSEKLPKLEKTMTNKPFSPLKQNQGKMTQSAVLARAALPNGGTVKMDVTTIYGGKNPLLTRLKFKNRAKRLSF